MSGLKFEALLSRIDMVFTQGYHFYGNVDLSLMKQSYYAITAAVKKLAKRPHYQSQTQFTWQKNSLPQHFFRTINTHSFTSTLSQISHDGYQLLRTKEQYAPFGLIVLQQQGNTCQEFMLVTITDHCYLDAQSANYLFKLIIQLYNAYFLNNSEQAANIISKTQQLTYPDSIDFIQQLTDHQGIVNHPANITAIQQYSIATDPAPKVDSKKLARFKSSVQLTKPISYDISDVINRIRTCSKQPLTKNSIVSALLAKCFHQVIPETANDNKGNITFAVAASLPSEQQRQRLSGNYMISISVTVDVITNSVSQLAELIQERVKEVKHTQQDLSRFILREEFLTKLNLIEDPHAFYLTNWTAHDINLAKLKLQNCEFNQQLGLLTVNPADEIAASYVNKQGIVICITANDRLTLSLTPSITNEKPLAAMLDVLPSVIKQAQ